MPKNNRLENFAISCDICSKALLLDQYSVDYIGADKIIYYPFIPQSKLNYLLNAIRFLETDDNELLDRVMALLQELSSFKETLNLSSSNQLSNPGILAYVMQNKEIIVRQDLINMRLLVDISA